MYLYQLCKAKAKLLGYVSYDIHVSVRKVLTRLYIIHVRARIQPIIFESLVPVCRFDSPHPIV